MLDPHLNNRRIVRMDNTDRIKQLREKCRIKEMQSAITLARLNLDRLEAEYEEKKRALITDMAGEMQMTDKQAEDTLSRVKRALADDNDDDISISLYVNKKRYTVDIGRIKELTAIVCNEFAPKALQLFVDKYDLEPIDHPTPEETAQIRSELKKEAKPVVDKLTNKYTGPGLKSISFSSHDKSVLVNNTDLYVDPVLVDKVSIAVENDDTKEVNRLTGFMTPIKEEQLKSIKVYPNVKL